MTDPTTTTEYGVVPKSEDLEAVVSVVEVEGLRFLDIRDRVVSTGRTGRGILIPLEYAKGLIPAIKAATVKR